MAKVEEGLFYTESHEYVRVEGEYGYVGITDYAQEQLGNVVYVVYRYPSFIRHSADYGFIMNNFSQNVIPAGRKLHCGFYGSLYSETKSAEFCRDYLHFRFFSSRNRTSFSLAASIFSRMIASIFVKSSF